MKITGVKILPCPNRLCKWNEKPRYISLSRLYVDSFHSAFTLPMIVCECTYHVQTEFIIN